MPAESRMGRPCSRLFTIPARTKATEATAASRRRVSTRCWARSGLAVMPSAKPNRGMVSIGCLITYSRVKLLVSNFSPRTEAR